MARIEMDFPQTEKNRATINDAVEDNSTASPRRRQIQAHQVLFGVEAGSTNETEGAYGPTFWLVMI